MKAGPDGGGEASSRPDLRLAVPAAAAWAAGWWGSAATPRAAALLAGSALALAVVVAGMLAFGRTRPARSPRAVGLVRPGWVLILAACASVLAAAAAGSAVRAGGPTRAWIDQGVVAEVSGQATGDAARVTAGPFPGPARYAVRITTDEVRARGSAVTASVPLLVLGSESWSSVTAGTRLTVTGRLAASEPGDRVAGLLRAYRGPQAVPGGWIWQAADGVRAGLRTACEGLGADAGGLLPSLVLGDTSRLPETLREDLRISGLTHLTAVSGANVAIVVGTALAVAAAAGLRRRPRLVAAGVALAAFVVLARPQPSVLRAGAMGAVALVGLAGSRRPRGVPVLSAAVLVLLVLDPWLARTPGFVLSVVATAALLLLAPAWTARLQRHLPRPLAMALAAPAAAQAACAPVVVLLHPTVSLVAVPANLVAGPAVAPATVLGVVAAALSTVWPWGAHVVAHVGGLATGWIALVAHRAAAMPAAEIPWPAGVPGALALAAVTSLFVVASLLVRASNRPPRAITRPRLTAARGLPLTIPLAVPRSARTAWAAALMCIALVAGWLLVPQLPRVSSSAWPPAGWAVAMCDVGQGDATVLRTGPRRAALIDVGPEPELVDRCLSRLDVRQIDLLVLTHPHADHVLGLPGALQGRTIARLLVSPMQAPAANVERVRRWATAAAVRPEVATAGMSGEVIAPSAGTGLSWQVVAPDSGLPPGASAFAPQLGGEVPGTIDNEANVALALQVRTAAGPVTVVALGDLENEGQAGVRRRLAHHPVLTAGVDVVKVAHHGSARQDSTLYRQLGARIGLIGVGAGNGYGHPAPATLSMLEGAGTVPVRTDVSGDVAVGLGPGGALVLGTSRDPP